MKDKFDLSSDLSVCKLLSTGLRKRLKNEGLDSLQCVIKRFASPGVMREELSLRAKAYQEMIGLLARLRNWDTVPTAWREAVLDKRSLSILEKGIEIAFGAYRPLMERCFQDLSDLNGFLLSGYLSLKTEYEALELSERSILHLCLKKLSEYLSESLPGADCSLSPLWETYLEASGFLSTIVEEDRFMGWPSLEEERLTLIQSEYLQAFRKRGLDRSAFLRKEGMDDFRAMIPLLSFRRDRFLSLPRWKGHRKLVEDLFEMTEELRGIFLRWEDAPLSQVIDLNILLRYAFLTNKERLFVREFWLTFKREPLFFLLYKQLIHSKETADRVWMMRHGLAGEPRSMRELQAALGKSAASIHQLIALRGSRMTRQIVLRIQEAGYAFLNEAILNKEGESRRVCEEERLPLSYRAFGGLVALTGDWSYLRRGTVSLWVNNALLGALSDKIYKALVEKGEPQSLRELTGSVEAMEGEVSSECSCYLALRSHPAIVHLPQSGKYALRSWNRPRRTVAEILSDRLQEAGMPLTLDELYNHARENFSRIQRSYLKRVLLKDKLGRFILLPDGRFGTRREP